MARNVALLRGINIVRHNRISMARLGELLADLGYSDVKTHLQSGNAVFTSPKKAPTTLAREIESRIARDLELDVAVLVVTGEELAAVVDGNTLLKPGRDPAELMVAFLSANPPAATLQAIDPDGFAPDELAVGDKAIYLWLPSGFKAAKLPAVLSDKRLGVTVTMRNWRTVTKLAELANG